MLAREFTKPLVFYAVWELVSVLFGTLTERVLCNYLLCFADMSI